jgi:hypothetical protein
MHLEHLLLVASQPPQTQHWVDPSGGPQDCVPYAFALRQLCCFSDDDFQEMMDCIERDPVFIIDNAKYVSRSVLSIISKFKRERSVWQD